MLIENEVLSLAMLKTELVASKLVTAKNHLASSTKVIGGQNEKIAFAYSF